MPGFFFTPIRIKAQLLLMRATNALPREQREWGRALISELNEISGFWPCLEWIVGGMMAISKAALHNAVHNILTGAWRKAWPGTALCNGRGDRFHSAAGAFLFRFRILAQPVGNPVVLCTDRALALTPRTGCGLQHHLARRTARNTTLHCPIESGDPDQRGSGGRGWWDGKSG